MSEIHHLAAVLESGGEPVEPEAVAPSPHAITTYSAAALRDMEFPEPRWAVEGLIAEGCTILASRPKIGKSWLVLNLALSITTGATALDKISGVELGDVLYAALEDKPRRLQDRMAKLLGEQEAWPERLEFVHDLPRLGEGCIETLRSWCEAHPDRRLIVIDTFTKIRPPRARNADVYLEDSVLVAAIQALAQHYRVPIVIVYHTRKAPTLDDPFDAVSGSLGLTGSADTTLVLIRQRGQADATMHMTGRDVEEKSFALRFDAETCRWALLGDADVIKTSQERQAILDLLAAADDVMAPQEVAEALDRPRGGVRNLLSRMAKAGDVERVGRGQYRIPGDTMTRAETKAGTGSQMSLTETGSGDNDDRCDDHLSLVTQCLSDGVTAQDGIGTRSADDCHHVSLNLAIGDEEAIA